MEDLTHRLRRLANELKQINVTIRLDQNILNSVDESKRVMQEAAEEIEMLEDYVKYYHARLVELENG